MVDRVVGRRGRGAAKPSPGPDGGSPAASPGPETPGPGPETPGPAAESADLAAAGPAGATPPERTAAPPAGAGAATAAPTPPAGPATETPARPTKSTSAADPSSRGKAEEATLDPVWARVLLARNPRRPHTLELLAAMADDVFELHGDRLFGDDRAIVAGLASVDGRRVAFVGMQKGADTDENIRRNFGMPHPEGYRKGIRVMELAERFGLPVVTLIDVPGAHPGAGAEERGIADSIARSIGLMTRLRTPVVAVITGEGGSGGALALAVADVVIALENAVYSVITPEGCASILWRTPDQAPAAARAMRMSAGEQQELGVVDIVVPEPPGGAHLDHAATAGQLRPVIVEWLDALAAVPVDQLVERRYRRFRAMGPYTEAATPALPAPERPGLADRLRNLLDLNRWAVPQPTTQPGGARQPDEPPARDEV